MDLLQMKDLLSNSGWGLIILLTLIQIAPIKINPWNSVLKFLGRLMNAELNEKMDGFKRDLVCPFNLYLFIFEESISYPL
mgnify:CR=1 FL=1